MADPIENAILPSTVYEKIVAFLERECNVTSDTYDVLYARVAEWALTYPVKGAVNEFNPVMLIEQVRREFDPTVDFVQFALVLADLQMGPRMMKMGGYDQPVWLIAIQGFPALIEEAQRHVQSPQG